MKNYIPNLITCCNLLSGCISILFLCNELTVQAGIMIFIAACFDFLDGFSARLLKVNSPVGAELDSLSDVVSFGVAPSFILYYYINQVVYLPFGGFNILPFIAFLLAIFSALRLAKFNIDDRQTASFIGLPTPATAFFVASLPIALNCLEITDWQYRFIMNPYFLFALIVVFCFLMTSEIPFFSFKIKNIKFKDNILRYFVLIFAVVALIVMGWVALPFIILFYIILSLFCYRGEK